MVILDFTMYESNPKTRRTFEKERFEALVSLADFRRKVREERRQLEWKLSLALWVAMGAGMLAFRDHPLSNCALGVGLIFVIGLHAIWVNANYTRNERDAGKMYDHLDQAQAMFPLHGKHKDIDKWKCCGWLCDAVVMSSFLTTIILAAFWFFIVNVPPRGVWVPY
jgi:hypothetical protein